MSALQSVTLGLVIIARNEEERIRSCIDQCANIADAALVIDTGSTDGTISEARKAGAMVKKRRWVNFAHARTQALRAGAELGTNYLLMLDADHEIATEGRRPRLTADAYAVRIRGTGELEWRLPLLTKASHPFEYRGAAHAFLASDEPYAEKPLDWLIVTGGPGATQEKLERDRAALQAAFVDNPADTRTVFYLAQTYRDLGDWEKAIFYYRMRASMGGWPEEVYYARCQLGVLLCENVSFAQGAPELFTAWHDRPQRIEALRWLANAANAVADKAPIPQDALFLSPGLYTKAA